jgi:hypothetical protein
MIPTEKRLSREEERLMALSIIPLIPVYFFIIVYVADLKSNGVIASFSDVIGYIILAGALWLVTGCGIYEVASSPSFRWDILSE